MIAAIALFVLQSAQEVDCQIGWMKGDTFTYSLESTATAPAKINDATKAMLVVSAADEKAVTVSNSMITRSRPLKEVPAGAVQISRRGRVLTTVKHDIVGYLTCLRLPDGPVKVGTEFLAPTNISGVNVVLKGKLVRLEGKDSNIAVFEMEGSMGRSATMEFVAKITSKFDVSRRVFLQASLEIGDAERKAFRQTMGVKLIEGTGS